MGYGLGTCFNVTSNDVNYIPLPLYHSSGGCIGIGMTLLIGNTAAIRNKFSASKFFEDCGKYGATVSCFSLLIPGIRWKNLECGSFITCSLFGVSENWKEVLCLLIINRSLIIT